MTTYVYDPIATRNPLLYRGYVYDWETELYYLQSRYYNPKIGRFINADGLVSTGQGLLGNNMFAYCLNNPVMLGDWNGEVAWWVIVLDIVKNAVINVGATWLAAKVTGQNYTWTDAVVMAVAGAANSIPSVGWLVDGIISGGYAAYTSYKNGTSTKGIIATSIVNGVCSTISVGNVAKYLGNTLDEVAKIAADVVFGSGNSLVSAGVSQGIANKNSSSKYYTCTRELEIFWQNSL